MPFLQGWPGTDLQKEGHILHPSCLLVVAFSKGKVIVFDDSSECISQEIFVVAGLAGRRVGVYNPLQDHLDSNSLR